MGFWDKIKTLLGLSAKSSEQRPEGARSAERLNPEPASPPVQARGDGSQASDEAPSATNPYEISGTAKLSSAQVRRRFFQLKKGGITPYFRPNEIPSTDDEFTQLVDRSMVLAGLITEDELIKIHQLGDEWLKYEKADRYAKVMAAKSGDEAVQQLRQERKERKIKRRQEAKERKQRRLLAIQEHKDKELIHLGSGVSAELNDHRSNIERLESHGLPLLSHPQDLATALNMPLKKLRWLSFHEEASTCIHYWQFAVPKRSEGQRLISAPKPQLKEAQSWILRNILARRETETPAHGFVPQRSVVSNAEPHVGKDIIVNLDLEDFFPTITFARVRGVFKAMGYSPSVSSVLALLATECERRRVAYAGSVYHVAVGDRALPQGAPTSPALSNQVARRLDRRLFGLAHKVGWTYTRYADDLSFSARAGHRKEVGGLLASVRHIVEDEGFRINAKKGRVQRRGRRQEVTGIVVNHKPGLLRAEVRKLRAILHNAQKTGIDAQNRDGRPHFEAWLRGKIAYLSMVDPAKGAVLLKQFQALHTNKV